MKPIREIVMEYIENGGVGAFILMKKYVYDHGEHMNAFWAIFDEIMESKNHD